MKSLFNIIFSILTIILMCSTMVLGVRVIRQTEEIDRNATILDSLSKQVEARKEVIERIEKTIKRKHHERIQQDFQQAD